ncbi:hypothetical protein F4814DRAFT_400074 [Daldinia grandis]|nr:hypothetical protein F4814DRAFT_400074 [Daldinia grandis]
MSLSCWRYSFFLLTMSFILEPRVVTMTSKKPVMLDSCWIFDLYLLDPGIFSGQEDERLVARDVLIFLSGS